MLVWNLVPWMWFCSMINHTSHQNSTFLWMLLPLSPLQKIIRLMEELSDSATIKFLKTYMGAGLTMGFPAHLFHQKGNILHLTPLKTQTLPYPMLESLYHHPRCDFCCLFLPRLPPLVYIFGHLWFFVVIFSVCCPYLYHFPVISWNGSYDRQVSPCYIGYQIYLECFFITKFSRFLTPIYGFFFFFLILYFIYGQTLICWAPFFTFFRFHDKTN